MSLLEHARFRAGVSVFILFVGWAGDAVRNLLGWYAYGAIVLLVLAGGIALIAGSGRRLTLNTVPIPLVCFLALITLSIIWSQYRPSSVLGVATTWITVVAALGVAVSLSWPELLRVLGWVFRAILGLSYLFELVVSLVFRQPIFPVWLVPDDLENPAKLLYWSRNLLFDLGKIQGIVGNSSLLAMVSLVALVVFSTQLVTRSVGKRTGVFWILVAVATLGLTRSATIFIAVAAVLLVAVVVLVHRRTAGTRWAVPARTLVALSVVGAVVAAIVLRGPALGLLGKSADFTGRLGIWDAVIGLAVQQPALGWGWISYWVPWAAPFDNLIVRGGVQVLHAHNAWLDIWLQLGVVGLIVFGSLVVSTLWRSWQLAVDPVVTASGNRGSFTWLSVLPLLLLTCQLVQSIAESRMLIEGGLMLLVIAAVMTKRDAWRATPATAAR